MHEKARGIGSFHKIGIPKYIVSNVIISDDFKNVPGVSTVIMVFVLRVKFNHKPQFTLCTPYSLVNVSNPVYLTILFLSNKTRCSEFEPIIIVK